MKETLEAILADSTRMARYKEDPIKEATLMALYAFVAKGFVLTDLPWFEHTRLAKRERSMIKAAA